MSEPLYYIQNKGYQGNCLVWWADGGSGYTCDLDSAWKVPKNKALAICESRPDQDFPRAVADVEKFARRYVTQEFERAMKDLAAA